MQQAREEAAAKVAAEAAAEAAPVERAGGGEHSLSATSGHGCSSPGSASDNDDDEVYNISGFNFDARTQPHGNVSGVNGSNVIANRSSESKREAMPVDPDVDPGDPGSRSFVESIADGGSRSPGRGVLDGVNKSASIPAGTNRKPNSEQKRSMEVVSQCKVGETVRPSCDTSGAQAKSTSLAYSSRNEMKMQGIGVRAPHHLKPMGGLAQSKCGSGTLLDGGGGSNIGPGRDAPWDEFGRPKALGFGKPLGPIGGGK